MAPCAVRASLGTGRGCAHARSLQPLGSPASGVMPYSGSPGRPACSGARAAIRRQIHAGAHAHGLEHEHQVFGDHVAGRAGRIRAAAQAAQRTVEGAHTHVIRRQAIGQAQAARVVHMRRAGALADFGAHPVNRRRTCAGLAMPVVSDRPIRRRRPPPVPPPDEPPRLRAPALQRAAEGGGHAGLDMHLPGAASALRSATMRRTSATISSRVLRTLAIECAALADTGMVSLCTPAASAASAPRRLGTSAITVTPGCVRAWRTTSAASAICGSRRAGTKEPTSISRRPAATSASIQRTCRPWAWWP
jgi:hypothetical protein